MFHGVYDYIARSMQAQDALAAQRTAADALADVRDLREQLEHLALINMAMWTLAKDKLGITDDELAQRVEELDLKDGIPDGKMTPVPANCPQCGRRFPPRRRRFIYCGTGRE